MPVAARLEERIEIPESIRVEREGDEVTFYGENGEASKTFGNPKIDIDIKEDEIILSVDSPSKEEKALIGTYRSHLNNMVQGVQEDFVYKLKIIYSHFPMKVRVEEDEIVCENFVGESEPRKAPLLGDTKAEIDDDILILRGPNREEVAQTAANVESSTKIKGADPRVFQDGIYIIEKAGKPLV